MQRIAVDMDEVIADFMPKYISRFNETYDENIQLSDLVGRTLRDLRPELGDEILDMLREPSFFRDLQPMKDSQRVIERLSKRFEIFITTAAMEFPTSFTAKYEWLREHFHFISDMNYVFCGDKSIIAADYLIDDNIRHFQNFRGTGLLFTAHHNVDVQDYTRLDNWMAVEEFFAGK